ncbi:hypothetical protein Tco_0446730 [Tanacetum coccineum]
MRFFSLKGAWGRERRIGKITGSANDVAKDIVNVVSFVVDGPVLSSLGGHTGEKVIASGNVPLIKASVVPINVTDSPTTDPNNSGLILSGPTSYAKLLISEPSRKSVNFGTLIALARNGANVAISLEPVRAISERFADIVYGFFLFSSKDGIDSMLENVWVKFHGVPMTALSEDGLSVISIKLALLRIVPTQVVKRSKMNCLDKMKLMFLDDDGKPLYNADFTSIADSDREVEEVFN